MRAWQGLAHASDNFAPSRPAMFGMPDIFDGTPTQGGQDVPRLWSERIPSLALGRFSNSGKPTGGLGDIVKVPSVKEARERVFLTLL